MAEENDWKPNGRPQSCVVNSDQSEYTHGLIRSRTIARSFSAALNEAFMIDNSLDGLTQAVEQKCASPSLLTPTPKPLQVPVLAACN